MPFPLYSVQYWFERCVKWETSHDIVEFFYGENPITVKENIYPLQAIEALIAMVDED